MLGSVKLTLPDNRRSWVTACFLPTSNETVVRNCRNLQMTSRCVYKTACHVRVCVCVCFTCGCVCLSDGVYSVHAQCSVVFLLSLQGEHHFSQCVSNPPPLQNHTWQRVQGAELLQHILPTSLQVSLSTGSQGSGKN